MSLMLCKSQSLEILGILIEDSLGIILTLRNAHIEHMAQTGLRKSEKKTFNIFRDVQRRRTPQPVIVV